MKLYFAPMEGITTYTYRNVHERMFGGADCYFSPFITPTENEKLGLKALRDVDPCNSKVNLTVQVLMNNADAFLRFEETVKKVGYDEININLGCPSGTVVKKNKGSGLLRDFEKLDELLDVIFENTCMKVSVKTRIGFFEGDEIENLMKVYNKYPIKELTVHPRTRAQLYKGTPDMEAFDTAYNMARMPICYNGNVFDVKGYEEIVTKYPNLNSVMLGRGAIANPGLFREINGGEKTSTEEIVEFSIKLMEEYNKLYKTDKFTLNKLKEIWMYIMWNYPEETKLLKEIKKSATTADFKNAIMKLK